MRFQAWMLSNAKEVSQQVSNNELQKYLTALLQPLGIKRQDGCCFTSTLQISRKKMSLMGHSKRKHLEKESLVNTVEPSEVDTLQSPPSSPLITLQAHCCSLKDYHSLIQQMCIECHMFSSIWEVLKIKIRVRCIPKL